MRLTPDQRETLTNAALGTVVVVASGIVALWIMAALIIGSIDLAHRLEGWT